MVISGEFAATHKGEYCCIGSFHGSLEAERCPGAGSDPPPSDPAENTSSVGSSNRLGEQI